MDSKGRSLLKVMRCVIYYYLRHLLLTDTRAFALFQGFFTGNF